MNIDNMILGLLVFTIPIISVTYIVVGIKLLKREVGTKINYFSFLMFACAIYSFGYFLELNCVSIDTLLFIRDIEFLGSVFVPTFGTLFFMRLTKVKVTKKVIGILFTTSIMLWLLFITNPLYHLIYKNISLRVVGGFGIVHVIRGPIFYSMMLYYVFFLLFSSILLSRAYKDSKITKHKNSFRFLFVTLQIAWLPIFFILFGFDKYIDPVPVTIIIISALVGINEIKNDMFELEISRWNSIFMNIGEPAFLVNKVGEIVCSNIDENCFFSNEKKSIKEIIEKLDSAELNRELISIMINNEIRWFAVKKNDFDVKSKFINYLLIDSTNRKLEEQQIHQLVKQLEIEKNIANLNSITDSLTGLTNRRYFDEALKTKINKLNSSGSVLSLIMLDIDYFKKFNDSYGHLAGDDCLRQVGTTLKTILSRETDIVSRYGGEEFVVILEETEGQNAKILAEKIRKTVEELAITHEASDISDFVTVSLGVVTVYKAQLVTPQKVVALADEAMYLAKTHGRNQIKVSLKR